MPCYEYKCNKCGHVVNKFQTVFIDLSPLSCPKCNNDCYKIISLSAFKLIGSGFYVNDYKKESNEVAE